MTVQKSNPHETPINIGNFQCDALSCTRVQTAAGRIMSPLLHADNSFRIVDLHKKSFTQSHLRNSVQAESRNSAVFEATLLGNPFSISRLFTSYKVKKRDGEVSKNRDITVIAKRMYALVKGMDHHSAENVLQIVDALVKEERNILFAKKFERERRKVGLPSDPHGLER